MCAFYIIEPFQRWATSKISTTMFHVFLSFTALLTFVEGAFQFNSSTFYLNTTCTLNIPVAAITVVGSPNDTVYQIFGTQEFVIHKLRGDLHMVRKPKDQDPLFYISASSWNGSVATAVVEVHHNCPTVSFDAVSYHFFALRRAPLSVIGNLKATGGLSVRYSTDSETFHVNETTGNIYAKRVLAIDATSIFYVKAADAAGNMDVAEVVVEVIGCFMSADLRQEAKYDVVFEKRCYSFTINNCAPGAAVGAIRAKGLTNVTYECSEETCPLLIPDGSIIIQKFLEPGRVHLYNIIATNGPKPTNNDVTQVSVHTKKCVALTSATRKKKIPTTSTSPTSATTTTLPLPTTTPSTTNLITTTATTTTTSTTTTYPVTMSMFPLPTFAIPAEGSEVTFNWLSDHFRNTINVRSRRPIEPITTTPEIESNVTLSDIFDCTNDSSDDPTAVPYGTLEPMSVSKEAPVNKISQAQMSQMATQKYNATTTVRSITQPFVVLVHSGNRSRTIRPVHLQKGSQSRVFMQNARKNVFRTTSLPIPGMEIVR